MILTPAYGRDYKSKKELLADFNADLDFYGRDFLRDGYINRAQLIEMGVKSVQARYGKLMKVCMVTLKDGVGK